MGDERYNVTRTVTLKKGEGRSLKAGGLWVYDNEIASVIGGGENGADRDTGGGAKELSALRREHGDDRKRRGDRSCRK